MSAEPSAEDMRKIAAGFAELLHLLTHDGNVERPKAMRDLLIDRLRDALDRRLPSLADHEPTFLGNSFVVEAVVHRNERTEISRLRHRDLGTLHAMKTIPADRANEAIDKALLLREARVGLMLRDNNLVATQCALRLSDGRPAIIMDWVGPSLSQRLAVGSLSAVEVKAAAKSLLNGLNMVHQAGYVHGDISSANILVDGGDLNQLKIADFATMVKCGTRYCDLDIAMAATPGFTAPEVSADRPADPCADLYSAGRVLTLLLERCSDAGETTERLRAIALRLSHDQPSQRPPDAMAALALFHQE